MAKYRHAKKLNIQLLIIIILAVLVVAAVTVGIIITVSDNSNNKNNTESVKPTVAPTAAPTVTPTEIVDEDPEVKYAKLAQEYMQNMSLEDKIYQMLMVSPEALTGVDVVTMAGPSTEAALSEKPVGGILYSEQNFESDEQTNEMVLNTKSYAKYPLFIATQKQSENIGTYTDQSEANVFEDADAIGAELHRIGINFNLAPSAVISGDNAYNTDPTVTGMLVKQAVLGLRNNGIISTLCSFPDEAENSNPYDVMKTSEFVPFVTVFTEGADVVMMSAEKASGIDPDYPAFMSSRMIKELLIGELKFNGLILSPVMNYDPLNSEFTKETMVAKAIEAGVNMFICTDDVESYVEAIKAAVDNGSISEDMINESVSKILSLKFKYNIINEGASIPQTETSTEAPTDASTDVPTEEVTATEDLY